ncbi:MAG: DUF4384 domain-containing protein [Lentisphaeria bacterium]|nr:DUF4384 domain-containing protein [Lentisphaeria bacterium]
MFWDKTKKIADGSIIARKITGKEVADSEKQYLYNIFSKDNTVVSCNISVADLKKVDGVNFYISPYSYTYTCQADFTHPDCSGKLAVSAVLEYKIIPTALGFGNWLLTNRIESLTAEALNNLFQQEEYGIVNYLQKIITGHNLSLLMRKKEEAVNKSCFGQDPSLQPWLHIVNIHWNNMEILPTAAQKQIEKFNKESEERNLELERMNLHLAHEANINAIDEARKKMLHQNKLDAIERESAIKLAEAQAKLEAKKTEFEQYRLDNEKKLLTLDEQLKKENLDILSAASESQKEEMRRRLENLQQEKCNLEQQGKILQAELEAAQQNFETSRQVAESNIQISKINLDKMRIELDTALTQKQEAEKKLNLLDNDEKIRQAELERIEIQKKYDEELFQAKLKAITAGSVIDQTFLAAQQKIKEENEQIIDRIVNYHEENKRVICYDITQNFLVDIVRKQQLSCAVTLSKCTAVQKIREINSRDLSLKINIKTSEIKVGDSIKFTFKSERSGYLTVLCFGSSCLPDAGNAEDGKIIVMEPNIIDGHKRVEAGETYALPGSKFLPDLQGIAQVGPTGTERLLAIVTDTPLLNIPEGLQDFDTVSPVELHALAKRLEKIPAECWAGGYLSYHVTD